MSDFATQLLNFASSKLEGSPDLRQQVLHTNLIRHILLLKSNPGDHINQLQSSNGDFSSTSQSQLYEPQSAESHYSHSTYSHSTSPSSQNLTRASWSCFTFEDELDRTLLLPRLDEDDEDIDMEDSGYHFGWGPGVSRAFSFEPVFGCGSIDCFESAGGNVTQFSSSSSLVEPFSTGTEPQHSHSHDQLSHYLTDMNEAQKDWLDSVLEDLMEEDRQYSEDESDEEYNDDDDDEVNDDDDNDIRSDSDATGDHDAKDIKVTPISPISPLLSSSSVTAPFAAKTFWFSKDLATTITNERSNAVVNDSLHGSKHFDQKDARSKESKEHSTYYQDYHHQRPLYFAASQHSPLTSPLSTSPPSPYLQPLIVNPSTSPPPSPTSRALEAFFSDNMYHPCPPCLGFHSPELSPMRERSLTAL
ncbi:hypothetical protein BGZ94_001110 [Podila epigama]|nr:hypothetical protein BGZ94_001110 [Podila epigama]